MNCEGFDNLSLFFYELHSWKFSIFRDENKGIWDIIFEESRNFTLIHRQGLAFR